MVKEYSLAEGYYCLKNVLLLKLVKVMWREELGYVVEVVAVSQKVPKDIKDMLLRNDQQYKSDKVHIGYVFMLDAEAVKLDLVLVAPEMVSTIKLLYTSDQSAEGTTVEANIAISMVSDAKSSGGQNAHSKS